MIKGKKVVLREKRLEDAADDYAWRRDSELCRLDASFPIAVPFMDFLASYMEEFEYQSLRRRRLAIETLNGRHIGNLMYYDIDERRGEAELGVMIGDRDYWDRGYGTDAITTLINHIFQTTNLERIYLNTLNWNLRAQRCFEKCGFVACGHASRGGHQFVVMEVRRGGKEKGG